MLTSITGDTILGWVETVNGVANFSIKRTLGNPRAPDIDSLQFDDELKYIFKEDFVDAELMESKPLPHLAKLLQGAPSFQRIAETIQKHVIDIQVNANVDMSKKRKYVSLSDTSGRVIRIMDDISAFGWERVKSIDSIFSTVTFSLVLDQENDEGDENGLPSISHSFDVLFPVDYPFSSPLVTADLPEPIRVDWSAEPAIAAIDRAIRSQVRKYAKVFEVLADIDANSRVLEPSKPTFAVLSRRIVVEKAVTIVILIEALDPLRFCELEFMGPPARINELKARYHSNKSKWNSAILPLANISRLLEMEIPRQLSADVFVDENCDAIGAQCDICYSYLLSRNITGGDVVQPVHDIPEELCANKSCNRAFHTQCIVQTLQAKTTTRSSFGCLFGQCPFCKEPMVVKFGGGN